MKTIAVGQLRQNLAVILAEVESGETYRITCHSREIALVVPREHAPPLLPAKRRTGSRLADLPRHELRCHELRSANSISELLADERDR